MSSLILAAPPVPGELTPILELARDLVARSHEVLVVTTGEHEAAVRETGARFVSVGGAADTTDAAAEMLLEAEWAALEPGPAQLNFGLIHAFVDALPDQYATLQRLLAENPDRMLIANSLFLGAWPVALGAPGLRPARWIAVGATPLMVSSTDTGPFGPVPVGPGEDPHAGNIAASADWRELIEPTRLRLAGSLRALGATEEVAALTDAATFLPDVFAVLTIPEFDFPRTDLPSTVRYVGILTPRQVRGWVAPDWWGELDGARAVVAVTQGTVANDDLSALVEPTLTALADRDVLVVAATCREPGAVQVAVPANARVTSFVPFPELLPRCDLLVTNGGFGGMQQALAAGVPVVVAGDTEDKPMTAARVAFHGVGADLRTSTPTPEEIAAAVDQVLSDPTVSTKVERIASAYLRYDARAEIAALVETP